MSMLLNYAAIFLLYNLLVEFREVPNVQTQRNITGLALLQLAAFLGKSQAKVLQLYFCRRAGTRVRQMLMTAIADKALKRPMYSSLEAPQPPPSSGSFRPSHVKRPSYSRRNSLLGSISGLKFKAATKAPPSNMIVSTADEDAVADLMSHTSSKIGDFVATSYSLSGAPFEIALCWGVLAWYLSFYTTLSYPNVLIWNAGLSDPFQPHLVS